MDSTTLTGVTGAASFVAALMSKGGWDWLKSRREASASVQTAQIVDDSHIRAELWEALQKMQERTDGRIDSMQLALDSSRREYIELLSEHALLKAEHASLKSEHESLRIKYAALELRVNNAA